MTLLDSVKSRTWLLCNPSSEPDTTSISTYAGEVVTGAWLDGSFLYNIIPKSSDKLLVLALI